MLVIVGLLVTVGGSGVNVAGNVAAAVTCGVSAALEQAERNKNKKIREPDSTVVLEVAKTIINTLSCTANKN